MTDDALRGPPKCPSCAYDPSGDDVEFRSGGGWKTDNFITDSIWTDRLLCPVCGTVVAEKEQQLGDYWNR